MHTMLPELQIRARCSEIFTTASDLYAVDLHCTQIKFDLRGTAAGQALRRSGQYMLRLNSDWLDREAFKFMLDCTVPHEIAHLVCFMNPQLGQHHNTGWQQVCRALGGTPDSKHTQAVVFGRGRTFEYMTHSGTTVRMNEKHHAAVQQGSVLRYPEEGAVTQLCGYRIVGKNGRTLAQPIEHSAANSAESIAAALRTVGV